MVVMYQTGIEYYTEWRSESVALIKEQLYTYGFQLFHRFLVTCIEKVAELRHTLLRNANSSKASVYSVQA